MTILKANKEHALWFVYIGNVCFAAFKLLYGLHAGELRLNNTSATRIVVNPLVPERESLAAVFQDTRGTLIVLPSELQSVTDLGEVVRQSFRTIQ
ncbi:hypothetical protein LINPERHAP2_LOCUS21938 [Linum perenne]